MGSEIELILYPSGFLGGNKINLSEPMTFEDEARKILNGGYSKKNNDLQYCLTVGDLWQKLISRNLEANELKYQLEVIELAMRLIPNMTMTEWVSAQVNSGFFTDSHKRYLIESLRFIFERKKRTMLADSWKSLLDASTRSVEVKNYQSEIMTIIYPQAGMNGRIYTDTQTTHAMIYKWARGKSGISDMITCLNVLFGKR